MFATTGRTRRRTRCNCGFLVANSTARPNQHTPERRRLRPVRDLSHSGVDKHSAPGERHSLNSGVHKSAGKRDAAKEETVRRGITPLYRRISCRRLEGGPLFVRTDAKPNPGSGLGRGELKIARRETNNNGGASHPSFRVITPASVSGTTTGISYSVNFNSERRAQGRTEGAL